MVYPIDGKGFESPNVKIPSLQGLPPLSFVVNPHYYKRTLRHSIPRMKGTDAATNSDEGNKDPFGEVNDNPPTTLRIVTMNCNNIYDRCLRENQHRFQQAAVNQDIVLFPEFHLNTFRTQDPRNRPRMSLDLMSTSYSSRFE